MTNAAIDIPAKKGIPHLKSNGVGNSPVDKATQRLELPPGQPRVPYVLSSLCGEIIYIPCSRSATRLLVTGKETDNAFAVVGSGGAESAPIGFHYHNEAHDVFLCLKGQVNVWAGDQARTMNPGDFASVPPKTIHQYQILGPYTEFLGLIVPGGWEEFFRFIGEPYTSGPLFPLSDDRNPFEVLIPKLKAAAEQFDMIPVPQHPKFDPQPWPRDADNTLPGDLKPYFLRNGSGPSFILGGTVLRPLVTVRESAGRFEVASIEGSSVHEGAQSSLFSSSSITFAHTHHCFQVSDGAVSFSLTRPDGNGDDPSSTTVLNVGETIYIPAATTFQFEFLTRFAKVYSFSNGAGISEVLTRLGSGYGQSVLPEKARRVELDGEKVKLVSEELGFRLS